MKLRSRIKISTIISQLLFLEFSSKIQLKGAPTYTTPQNSGYIAFGNFDPARDWVPNPPLGCPYGGGYDNSETIHELYLEHKYRSLFKFEVGLH